MSKIRQAVIEILNQSGPLPADVLARLAGRSTLAMRYHLALLVREGLIVQRRTAPRGSVGRPQIAYELADSAHERLPKNYDALAAQLLDQVTETLGTKESHAMLRRVGRRIAASAPPLRAGAGIEPRMRRAARFLSQSGYMARWRKSNNELLLDVCNCPYRQVAQAHREVCDMDVAMIGALVDTPLKMTHCIANRDGQCQFVVPKISAAKR